MTWTEAPADVTVLVALARAAGTPAGPRTDPDAQYKPAKPSRQIAANGRDADKLLRRVLTRGGYPHLISPAG